MGYNLAIGNAVIEYSDDNVKVWAKPVSLDSAPAFGEPTDYSNERWPSYVNWSNFCENLDIKDIMYSEVKVGNKWLCPLIQGHPGAQPFTEGHYKYIKERVDVYLDSDEVPEHWDICRAKWLIFWMRWALDNCKMPVFVNS